MTETERAFYITDYRLDRLQDLSMGAGQLTIDLEHFDSAFKNSWSSATTRIDTDERGRHLRWRLGEGQRENLCTGTVFNGEMTYVDIHALKWSLPFIVWYRQYIPEQYSLYICTISFTDTILLTDNTTPQHIYEHFFKSPSKPDYDALFFMP